jgi:hypothetical protein
MDMDILLPNLTEAMTAKMRLFVIPAKAVRRQGVEASRYGQAEIQE